MIWTTCGVLRNATRRLPVEWLHKPFLSILALYSVILVQRSLLRSDIGSQQSRFRYSVKKGHFGGKPRICSMEYGW